MVEVISFVKLGIGKTEEVVAQLKSIPQIKEIDFITGAYDLVIIMEAKDGDEVHHLYMDHIEKIKGIVSMDSHLIMKRWLCKQEPICK